MADMSRRSLLRLGLGMGGTVALLSGGGRALAATSPSPATTCIR